MKKNLLLLLVWIGAGLIGSSAQTAQEFLNSGLKKTEAQDFEGAIGEFEAGLKIDEKNSDLLANLAYAQLKLEKYHKALVDINRAIKLKNDAAKYYHYRGVIKDSLKKYDESIKDYAKSLKLNQNDPEVYVSRANSFMKRKDYNTVVANLNVALQLNRRHAFAYYLRGNARFRLVDSSGACSDWKLAVELGYLPAKELWEKNCKESNE